MTLKEFQELAYERGRVELAKDNGATPDDGWQFDAAADIATAIQEGTSIEGLLKELDASELIGLLEAEPEERNDTPAGGLWDNFHDALREQALRGLGVAD